MNNTEFQRIINGSMAYEFDGTVLEVVGRYTGQRIRIDLGLLTDEMFEELVEEGEEE